MTLRYPIRLHFLAGLMLMLVFMLILTLFSAPSFAVVTSRLIEPRVTDALIEKVNGAHRVLWNDELKDNGLLLISFAGTNAPPDELRSFDSLAVEKGFLAIALDYENSVISTYCRTKKQLDCFERFRKENMFGEDLLPDPVHVTPPNSVEHRIRALLTVLNQQNPKRWGQFLTNGGEPNWGKIVVVGHSQGSGDAVYLGKIHSLKGVVALAGPQDTSENGESARWMMAKGKTPTNRYFFLFHKEDAFKSAYQIKAARYILGNSKALVSEVLLKPKGHNKAHIFLSTLPVVDGHNWVNKSVYHKIWEQMLSRLID